MDELETRMRQVLLQLEMTSNGRTAAYDSSGGGEPDYVLVDDRGRARLSIGDAPQLLYVRAWNAARDDTERAQVLKEAGDELDRIRHSRADRTVEESKSDRDIRIVTEGEGWPASEVAIQMRCGIRDVHRARAGAGRDVEYGELRRNGRALTRDELNAQILTMHERKMSGREIATALGIAHNSVRYVVARAGARNGSAGTSNSRSRTGMS